MSSELDRVWEIRGFQRESGVPDSRRIVAPTQDAAIRKAGDEGIVVEQCKCVALGDGTQKITRAQKRLEMRRTGYESIPHVRLAMKLDDTGTLVVAIALGVALGNIISLFLLASLFFGSGR